MPYAVLRPCNSTLTTNVMKSITKIYTIAGIALLGSLSAFAQSTTPGAGQGEWREKWKHMTPEQKETFLQNHPKIAEWIAQHRAELEADASSGDSSSGNSSSGGSSGGSASNGSSLTGSTTGSPTGSTTTGAPGSTTSGAPGSTTSGATPGTSTTSTASAASATAGAANPAWKQKWEGMTPEQKENFLQSHPKLAAQFTKNHPEAAQRLGTTKEAGAGITDPGHPRVNEVNARETNQQNRIAQGVSNGSLTPQEQAQLQKSGNRIQKQEANDLAHHDGHLTAGEKARLNREENRRSRQIKHDEKHEEKHES